MSMIGFIRNVALAMAILLSVTYGASTAAAGEGMIMPPHCDQEGWASAVTCEIGTCTDCDWCTNYTTEENCFSCAELCWCQSYSG